jgi:hypothetical protein
LIPGDDKTGQFGPHPREIWVGWRGSREPEIQELLLCAHDIATTTANADLAFTRLKIKATALNKVALTRQ